MKANSDGSPGQHPAFPGFQYLPGHGEHRQVDRSDGSRDFEVWHPGMSLRAWLAGQALVGLMSRDGINPMFAGHEAVTAADCAIKKLSKP